MENTIQAHILVSLSWHKLNSFYYWPKYHLFPSLAPLFLLYLILLCGVLSSLQTVLNPSRKNMEYKQNFLGLKKVLFLLLVYLYTELGSGTQMGRKKEQAASCTSISYNPHFFDTWKTNGHACIWCVLTSQLKSLATTLTPWHLRSGYFLQCGCRISGQ